MCSSTRTNLDMQPKRISGSGIPNSPSCYVIDTNGNGATEIVSIQPSANFTLSQFEVRGYEYIAWMSSV